MEEDWGKCERFRGLKLAAEKNVTSPPALEFGFLLSCQLARTKRWGKGEQKWLSSSVTCPNACPRSCPGDGHLAGRARRFTINSDVTISFFFYLSLFRATRRKGRGSTSGQETRCQQMGRRGRGGGGQGTWSVHAFSGGSLPIRFFFFGGVSFRVTATTSVLKLFLLLQQTVLLERSVR